MGEIGHLPCFDICVGLRHEGLVAWQRADDLFIELHQLTLKAFPPVERFELGQQVRRAAFSVPANIAEGYARRSARERLHFLNIAEGSLTEVAYALHAARRLGYVSLSDFERLDARVRAVAAPLAGLMRRMREATKQ